MQGLIKKIIGLLLILVFIFAVYYGISGNNSPQQAVSSSSSRVTPISEDTIGIIHIEGVIAAGSSSFFTPGTDDILSQIRRAAQDPIAALVVRVNSSGGTAAASWEVYEELQKVRESGKIVVVSMADIAASGAYAIACAADCIVANPATMTGSIGVYIDATSMEGLYDLLGIRYDMIKSGEFKDTLNPGRSIEDNERMLLQAMVDDIYEQFLDIVSEGRGMRREAIIPYADGRVMTGRQALEAGLVDELGTFRDAIDIAATLSGLEGEPNIYRYGREDFWERLLSGGSGY
jgi:protease-4